MDDDEDFQALFFSETRELLDALLEHLNLMADEAGDSETVHAAFRAVHSVKGGAAAFGFDRLIGFAHIFETVMDRIREDDLALDNQLAQILLRSGDMLQVLAEKAEAGEDDAPIEGLDKLHQELAILAGEEPSAAESNSAPTDVENTPDEAPTDTPAEDSASTLAEITCRITPEDTFFESGHDILRLVRSARDMGLTGVHTEGQVAELAKFDPNDMGLTWELTFQTERTIDEVEAFFSIYAHTAQLEFIDENQTDEEDEDPEPDDEGSQGSGGGTDPDGGETAPDAPPQAAAEPAAKAADATQRPDQGKPGQSRPASGPASRGGDPSKSLRVEIARIDRLVNLVGEMLITQAALAQQITDGDENHVSDMAHSVDAMSRQLRELQESVMAIRAQPVKSVFRRMPRVVRDLAEKLGKEAKLELEGENTEVDATVIEELSEPLIHMIRNSMDHGLEDNDTREAEGKPRVGTIRLSAEHRGERVIITIVDDGKGVNRERVLAKAIDRGLVSADDQIAPEEIDMLIFHPGFSTAEEVSSVSGRGVGMDVVKKKIVALGGRCTLKSTPGKGTIFTITLPLTLAVMDGMTVAIGDQKYILPLSQVVEALNITRESSKQLPDGSNLLERRGEYLRLLSLRSALDLPPLDSSKEMAIVVDTETTGHVALTVDELIGQRQIVLKSLEANFRKVDGISGATILGDGQVALILDVPALVRMQSSGFSMQEVYH
ncbi:MAG: chemotaxis protein CheA [Pseudomonadota bacterium]